MRTLSVRVETQSQASPAALYRLLADARSWPHWSDLDECTPEGIAVGETERVGTVRRSRRGRTVGWDRTTVLDPDRTFGYQHVKGLPVRDYVAAVELAPNLDGTTRLTWGADFRPRIPGTGAILRRGIEKFLSDCVRGLADHASNTAT